MRHYTKEDIIRLVREEDAQFIRMQFTDIFGQLKNVAITASQIGRALDNQIMMDGSSIAGFVRIEESDQYLWPDLDTFAILPWRPQYGKVARLICDVHNPDGTAFAGDPRGVLKRVLRRADALGFTVSKSAASISLLPVNTPYAICIIYLGFGAGLAVFMFCGFVKSIPLEIEEAATIDGCNPLQTYGLVVLPILKPTLISVAILQAMWVWNDYLLPTLVLDIRKYRTIPMLIQYFRGSYGRVEMGPMMACILLTILPIIVFYLACQKYIIEGVVAGAVKG